MILTIIAFIIVIGLLILVHEFGHFIAAKLAGVKVLEFAIGFPPRIFSFTKKETKYTIGSIPIGGYVKMLGEDESSKDPGAYNNQSAWKRFIIGIAGVLMNVVLAWLLLSIGFVIGMSSTTSDPAKLNGNVASSHVYVAEVAKNSAAEKAGVKVGDELVGVDNENLSTMKSVTDFTKSHSGQTVGFWVKRDGEMINLSVNLPPNVEAPLGVSIVQQDIIKVPWYKAPLAAAEESANIIKYTFSFLGSFAKQLFGSGTISDQVGGPVAIFSMSGAAARAGIVVFLQFIAVLSLNLALINILPLPALDGGRVFFIILEKIFGKRIVKEEVEGIIHTIGFVLLILLILAITYKDIVRMIHK